MSRTSKTTSANPAVKNISGLEMSRIQKANVQTKSATVDIPLDDDGGDVTDDPDLDQLNMTSDEEGRGRDSDVDTLPLDDDLGATTTTTSAATNKRYDTEDDDDDDDDRGAGHGATTEDDYYDNEDEDPINSSSNGGGGGSSSGGGNKKRRRKRKKISNKGDDALLIGSSRDKKLKQRNGQFSAPGVSNSAASVNKLEEDCWSKDLERDTPSPNLDESKKSWETRCIVVIILLVASVAAAIFVFFLAGPSKGENMVEFRFANYLSSHMVLQGSPYKAMVWGYGPKPSKDDEIVVVVRLYDTITSSSSSSTPNSPSSTSSSLDDDMTKPLSEPVYEYETKVNYTAGNTWRVAIGPVTERGPFVLTASLGKLTEGYMIRLDDVLFGDVWICSGHDRLHDTIYKLINSSDDDDDGDDYRHGPLPPSSSSSSSSSGDDDLRIFSVFPAKSDYPWFDIHVIDISWTVASHFYLTRIRDRSGHSSPRFPAACWLFGRRLRRRLGKPVGLVAAIYGDSSIEEWIPSIVTDSCNIAYSDSTSRIWNGMIHPLLDMQVRGLFWQQGDLLGEEVAMNYSCSVKEFFSHWRTGIRRRAGGANDAQSSFLPIGIIQMLPANHSQYSTDVMTDSSLFRWLLTDSKGYLPYSDMESTFLVVTTDLPNPEEIRQKKVMADRLLKGSLHHAYKTNVAYQAPMPVKYVAKSKNTLTLTFDTEIKIRNPDGFEICCSKSRSQTCREGLRGNNNFWIDSPVTSSSSSSVTLSASNCPLHIVGFRYTWNDSPCSFTKCPVYSRTSDLPMPPYVHLGLTDDGYVRVLDKEPVVL